MLRMRKLAATHAEMAERLDDLEQKTEGLALSHETFSRNTRLQLKQLFDAIRALITPRPRDLSSSLRQRTRARSPRGRDERRDSRVPGNLALL